jgi:hypothetical protein
MKFYSAIMLGLSLILTVGCTKDDDPTGTGDPVYDQTVVKNASEFIRYKYFFIENSFKDNMATPENYQRILDHQTLYSAPYKIKNYSFELYVTRLEIGSQSQADIYIDYTRPPTDSISGYQNLYKSDLYVKLIDPALYEINYDLGYIRLKSFYMQQGDIIAAKYIKQNQLDPEDITEIGSVDSTGTKLELQMLGEYDLSWQSPCSSLEWKNVYSLGFTNIKRENFKLTVQKEAGSSLQTEEYDNMNVLKPYLYWYQVNKIDAYDEVDLGFLYSGNGEFLFPNQTPFMPDQNSIIYIEGKADSLFTDPKIYTDPFYLSKFKLKFEFFVD